MNILIINHYAGSPKLGMEFRPYYLAREWQKMGNNVLIVSASFSHLRGEQPNVSKSIEIENREEVKYFWIKVPKYHQNNIKRFINISVFVFKLFFFRRNLISFFKPDVIISSSTYPFDMLAVNLLAKKCSSKKIFEIHDLWPLSPIELGGMSPIHPFVLLTKWAEKYALRKADKVVSILPLAKEYLVSKGMSPEKFVHIPNGINIEEWDENSPLPEEHSNLIKALKLKKQFLVGYIGSHSVSDSLETLIDAAKEVKNYNCAIILVGNGPQKEKLIKIKNELKLQNVHFLPYVPKTSVPSLLKRMDILYIGWKKRNLYKYGVSPTKLLDYMMAGKPIIYGISSGNDIVKECQCGITVEPENPVAVAEAIKTLLSLGEEQRNAIGEKGKRYVQIHFNYSKLAIDFLDSIKE